MGEWVVKFTGLFCSHQGPCKTCYYNPYSEILIYTHRYNRQVTYNFKKEGLQNKHKTVRVPIKLICHRRRQLCISLQYTLRWRHNDHAGVSNHQPHGCLLNRLFRRQSKKTSKLRVTGLCAGNSPGTGEFPAQMASYAENVSIWWRHHDLPTCHLCPNRAENNCSGCVIRYFQKYYNERNICHIFNAHSAECHAHTIVVAVMAWCRHMY